MIDNLKKRLAELYVSIEALSDERDSVRTQIAQLSTSQDGTPGSAVNEIYQVPYGKVLKLASAK